MTRAIRRNRVRSKGKMRAKCDLPLRVFTNSYREFQRKSKLETLERQFGSIRAGKGAFGATIWREAEDHELRQIATIRSACFQTNGRDKARPSRGVKRHETHPTSVE